jgi:hypothetical protein
MTATLPPPTTTTRVESIVAEYFELVAGAAPDGLDNAREGRRRELAKVLGRDMKADAEAARALHLWKRDVSATLPATDPTPAELEALARAADEADRARLLAQVDTEAFEHRDRRCRAYRVAEQTTSEFVDRMRALKATAGQKLVAASAARATAEKARGAARIRAIALADPEITQAIGLTFDEPAPAAKTKTRRA